MALLFRLQYLEGIEGRKEQAAELGVKEDSITRYRYRLRKRLVRLLGQVTPERLRMVCPECLTARIYDDPESGERVCTNCGVVVQKEPRLIHSLSFDQTFALKSDLVFNDNLGSSVPPKAVGRVLAKVRHDEEKLAAVRNIVSSVRRGKLSPMEAEAEIRDVFVAEGNGEIAHIIQQTDEKTGKLLDPTEAARRIINRFDAIPIRQIMTVHDVHEPMLQRKVKEYAERYRRQFGMDHPNPVCDPDVFSVALGQICKRVSTAALLDDSIYSHNPKELAGACYLLAVKRMNPNVEPDEDLELAKPETISYAKVALALSGTPINLPEPVDRSDPWSGSSAQKWEAKEVTRT